MRVTLGKMNSVHVMPPTLWCYCTSRLWVDAGALTGLVSLQSCETRGSLTLVFLVMATKNGLIRGLVSSHHSKGLSILILSSLLSSAPLYIL